jgi:hypothetical protein
MTTIGSLFSGYGGLDLAVARHYGSARSSLSGCRAFPRAG